MPQKHCFSIRVSTGFAGNIHIDAEDEDTARAILKQRWKDGDISIDDLLCDEYLDDEFIVEEVSDLGPSYDNEDDEEEND